MIEFDELILNEDKMLQRALPLPQIYAKKENIQFSLWMNFHFVLKNIGGNVLHEIRAAIQKHTDVSYAFLVT